MSDIAGKFRFEFLSRSLSTISSSLLIIVLARLLSPSEYGLLFLAISIMAIVEIFSKMGFAKSGARYISEYKEVDQKQLQHIIEISLKFLLASSIISAVLIVLTRSYFESILGEPGLSIYLLVGSLYILFSGLSHFWRKMLQGMSEIRWSSICSVCNKISRFTAATLLVLLGYGAIGAFLGYILGFVFSALVGGILTYVLVYKNKDRAQKRDDKLSHNILSYSLPLTATRSANVVYKEADTIFIGYFLNPVSVGYYAVSKQVTKFVMVPAEALGFTISPDLSSKVANNEVDKASREYENSIINTLVLYVPAGAGIFLLSEDIITYVFGEDYIGGATVLMIFGFYIILDSVAQLTGNSLDYIGRARSRSIIISITTFLNIVLNIFLIPSYGIVGAAVASVLTYGLYSLSCVIIMYDSLSLKTKRNFIPLLKIICVSSLMAVAVNYLSSHINSIISLIFVVLCGFSLWLCLSVVTGLINLEDVR